MSIYRVIVEELYEFGWKVIEEEFFYCEDAVKNYKLHQEKMYAPLDNYTTVELEEIQVN